LGYEHCAGFARDLRQQRSRISIMNARFARRPLARVSEVPLAAEEAPRAMTVQFHGLPRGEYSVSGEIRDVDGRPLATVHQEIRVLAFQ
jgi:hypothetical protein